MRGRDLRRQNVSDRLGAGEPEANPLVAAGMQDKEFDGIKSTADHGKEFESAVVVGSGRRRCRPESLERCARWLARRVTGTAHWL